jgi:hypothetical protein
MFVTPRTETYEGIQHILKSFCHGGAYYVTISL